MGNAHSGDYIAAAHALRSEPAQDTDAFWLRIFPEQAIPALEMFSVIQPEHVREMRVSNPRNLALAVVKAVEIMDDCISAPSAKTYPRLANAVRLLTRLLPILFEDHETAPDDFVRQLFWENTLPRVVYETLQGAPAATTAVAHAAADNGAGTAVAAAPASVVVSKRVVAVMEWTTRPDSDPTYPLGMQLVHCAMASLFLPDLTVDRLQYEMFVSKLASFRPAEGSGAAAEGAASRPSEGAAPPAPPAVIPDEANAVWPMLLWHGGVGFPSLQPPLNVAWNTPRVDSLRLLLALCSQPLYSPPSPQKPARSRFLDELVSSGCPFAPTLFYCLLNTISAYDPLGWGVPYATAIVGDKEEALVNAAVQVLLVLLDYAPLVEQQGAEEEEAVAAQSATTDAAPATGAAADDVAAAAASAAGRDGGNATSEAAAAAPPSPPLQQQQQLSASASPARSSSSAASSATYYAQFNMYRSMLAGLTDPADFDILFSAAARLLGSVPKSDGAMLPYALHQASCYQELLVLLWKLCDENSAFLSHVLTECDVTAIVAPVLYLMWSGRSNVTRVGLLHLSTFFLLLLSGSRSFGVGLNKAFNPRDLPADLPLFEGSHGDLLIIVLHKLVVDGSPKLSTLYSCFMTIIANISPYAKGVSLVAAVKLVNLFELFSSARFIFARPGNYAFAQQLLETFNNLVQYQYESNPVLVYTLLRRGDVFKALAALDMDAYRALDRPQLQQGKQQGSSVKQQKQTPVRLSANGGSSSSSTAAVVSPPGSAAAGTGLLAPAATATAPTASSSAAEVEAWARRHVAESADAEVDSAAPSSTAVAVSAATSSRPPSAPAPWTPSEAWLEGVHKALPVSTVLRLVEYLSPLVERHVAELATDDEGVIEFLRATTVVGVLPQPHPIVQRVYQPNLYTGLWFTTFLWSTCYLHCCKDLPMFDAEAIALFQITVV